MISLGGAIGAVLVGIVAPLVLPAYFELAARPRVVRAAAAVAGAPRLPGVRRARPRRAVHDDRLRDLGRAASSTTNAIVASRNFYGVLRVQEIGTDDGKPSPQRWSTARSCTATSTWTGRSQRSRRPTTRTPPASVALLDVLHPRLEPLSVGVIGLGTGTLAVYGTPGRHLPVLRHQSGRRRRREARLHLPARQRRDDRDRARRRAAGARARAAAELRRARDRRVLARRDPGPPDHVTRRCASTGST